MQNYLEHNNDTKPIIIQVQKNCDGFDIQVEDSYNHRIFWYDQMKG